jgi:hypothetical protein
MRLKKVIGEKLIFLGTFLAKNLFFGNNFFWVHFVIKVSLHFLNQRKNTDLLIPILAYFEKKKKIMTLYSIVNP